jgi:hypothetical protein
MYDFSLRMPFVIVATFATFPATVSFISVLAPAFFIIVGNYVSFLDDMLLSSIVVSSIVSTSSGMETGKL